MSRDYTQDQIIGSAVDGVNVSRQASEAISLASQDHIFGRSMVEVQKIREFVGSPENILGNHMTKHGEIAEHVEVGITNARSYLQGEEQRATFEGVGRTAPTDYMLDDLEVQSKFYNGASNSLEGIIKHLEKYEEYTKNDAFFHIPKDQYSIINKLVNGDAVEGVSQKAIDRIKTKVHKIEVGTGRDFNEVVKPGISDYAEVQQGSIHKTLDVHEKELGKQNDQIKDKIVEDHTPNLADGLKAGVAGAAVGGALRFAAGLYCHYKNGKNPFKGDLTPDDWKKLGVDTGKGALAGAVTGSAIYALTNYASLSAPFAAAIVSASKNVDFLYNDYMQGVITCDEFMDMGLIVCAESAMVGIATVAGQTLIPIPMLGAVIGSVAGQLMIYFISKDSGNTVSQVRSELKGFTEHLEETHKKLLKTMLDEFNGLGDLTDIAFDLTNNCSLLNRSIELSLAYGVDENKILKNEKDIDKYFLE